jgi:hypothetical protein
MRRAASIAVLLFCVSFAGAEEAALYQKNPASRRLGTSPLLTTDFAEVQWQLNDRVNNPVFVSDTTNRQSDFGFKTKSRLAESLVWNCQWQLLANSQFHEDEWGQESSSGRWRQLQGTDLVLTVPGKSHWQIRPYLQREDTFAADQTAEIYDLRQGLETTWKPHRWTSLRGELRQEQHLFDEKLDLQRDIARLQLTQQAGPFPVSFSSIPTLGRDHREFDADFQPVSQRQEWENSLQWSPQKSLTWSVGSKLRETEADAEGWREQASGFFTQWQQKFTSDWSCVARFEYEQIQRGDAETGLALRESERTHLRLRQSWTLTENTKAELDFSHSHENEKIGSTLQEEQRVGLALRSFF